jgi:carbon monoxide dehydrogenase subunit G
VIVDRSIRIVAPADETFRRCVDIPFVGACLPGARDVEPDGPDTYRGRFGIKVGPVSVSLQGTVSILESDAQARTAVLRLQGSDRRIGGEVVGDMLIAVVESSAEESRLDVHTDVTISGKLGQFGQAVVVKKADQITEAFVQEFSRRLTAVPAVNGAAVNGAPVAAPQAPAAVPAAAVPAAAVPAAAVPAAAVPAAAAPAPAPVAPAGPADPHALTALFRRGRRLALVRPGGPAARAGVVPWLADGADVPRAAGPRVVAVTAADEAELAARLPRPERAGTGPAVVAIVPRGAAVGDPDALARLGRAAAAAGHPVLLVATTPWAALPCARAAAAGAAHGVAVLLDTGPGDVPGGAALLALAVAEVRAAGLQLPVVVGPVADGPGVTALLERGADCVVVTPATARSRAASMLRRRLPFRRS